MRAIPVGGCGCGFGGGVDGRSGLFGDGWEVRGGGGKGCLLGMYVVEILGGLDMISCSG